MRAEQIDAFFKSYSLNNPGNEIRLTEVLYPEGEPAHSQIPRYRNEFWTSQQRQASSLHEVSYRACFKPQLPGFFIKNFSSEGDIVFDPFGGRGTTAIEATLQGRKAISNDINPLSRLLCEPRLSLISINDVIIRLNTIELGTGLGSELDLSMFYHKNTLSEIVSLRNYLKERKDSGVEDDVDRWIRMVATNRLSGHSPGFFSVYTLPPNQAVSPSRQVKINKARNQEPPYRDVKQIILKKSRTLLARITKQEYANIHKYGHEALFLNNDARSLEQINDGSVQLTVTSPPFLDVVQYATDNWLRCWFNAIDIAEIEKNITMAKKIEDWCEVMQDVLNELFRITRIGGYVAFEVGEVKKGKLFLDEYVIGLGINAGFSCLGIIENEQDFTKTSNIWGIANNSDGT
ncbi:MAG: site-specific DNA-methyltransferase, partial [Bacteroidales bacterium]|nr:site-specific DNA-methyltransferase [Bacteroidales bacterium]